MSECKHRMSWWTWRTVEVPNGGALQRWWSGCIRCRAKYAIDGGEMRPPGRWNWWLPIRFERPKV